MDVEKYLEIYESIYDKLKGSCADDIDNSISETIKWVNLVIADTDGDIKDISIRWLQEFEKLKEDIEVYRPVVIDEDDISVDKFERVSVADYNLENSIINTHDCHIDTRLSKYELPQHSGSDGEQLAGDESTEFGSTSESGESISDSDITLQWSNISEPT
jgi:hypothetical protein